MVSIPPIKMVIWGMVYYCLTTKTWLIGDYELTQIVNWNALKNNFS